MSRITIERKLEIIAGNKINVPGCEPTSAVSSVTLMRELAKAGLCKNAIVDVNTVLAAIPGARIEFGDNFGNRRQKWLVLPPFDPSVCPCVGETDWYGVIRSLASEDDTVTENFDTCNTVGMGYCPSPGFRDIPEPSPDPYVEEGYNTALQSYTP